MSWPERPPPERPATVVAVVSTTPREIRALLAEGWRYFAWSDDAPLLSAEAVRTAILRDGCVWRRFGLTSEQASGIRPESEVEST